jgi:hypothetical protein
MDWQREEVATLRVRVACEPPLLREILAQALTELADMKVEIVDGDGSDVDAVLVSAQGASNGWPSELPSVVAAHVRFVVLDPAANVLRVRDGASNAAREEVLPGSLSVLIEALRGASRPRRTVNGVTPC